MLNFVLDPVELRCVLSAKLLKQEPISEEIAFRVRIPLKVNAVPG
jgi:hypothetical protein